MQKQLNIEKCNNTEEEFKVNFSEYIEEEDFEIKINHLNEYQKSKIDKLIFKYKAVFAKEKYDIGNSKINR